MESQRAIVVIFLLLFFAFSPDTSQPSRTQRNHLNYRLLEEREALETLRNSSYGKFPRSQQEDLNNTGFNFRDGFSWKLLPEVKKRARAHFLEFFQDEKRVTGAINGTGSELAYALAADYHLPFYQNVSGTAQGDFIKLSLPLKLYTSLNLTSLMSEYKYPVQEFWRNVTEDEGGLTVRLFEEDREPGPDITVREVTANVAVRTESSPGSGWEMKLFGIHFPRTGLIILTTTSDKFPGIFTLPHFALTDFDFRKSKSLLNASLSRTISHQEDSDFGDPSFPWASTLSDDSTSIFSAPSCEYIIYLQQHPVHIGGAKVRTEQALELVRQVENELRFPEGAPIPAAPPMTFSAVVFSPDCGFVLESKGDADPTESHLLTGPKIEAFWTLIRRLLLALVIALGLQISLLKRQMDEASTPSMRSRTSYYTIAMMAMGDGLMLASLIAFSMANDAGFLLLTAAGFLCFFNFAFFEMKFIYDIWLVQVGHQRREEPAAGGQQAARARNETAAEQTGNQHSAQTANEAQASTEGLPLPVTARRPVDTGAIPIILPPDQDIEAAAVEDEERNTAATRPNSAARRSADFQTLYSRFYFTMLLLVFFSLWAFSWPRALRSAYVNFLCFAYLSFWIPQIYRNVMRNCRQAFTWEYVIGISTLRLLPILYCYTKDSNPLRIDIDPFSAAFLAGWMLLQVLALAVQQFLGPRLFVKESWCPPAYDYHPLLQDDTGDVESGSLLPIGFVASASEAKDKDDPKDKDSSTNRKIFDCAICMNEIDVPVVPKESADRSNLGATWLGRRTYMVTPCRHIFHTECLEGWMRLRLVCPICRESLPPL
jgi:transmembrane E3 ubiquitin-protein ligase